MRILGSVCDMSYPMGPIFRGVGMYDLLVGGSAGYHVLRRLCERGDGGEVLEVYNAGARTTVTRVGGTSAKVVISNMLRIGYIGVIRSSNYPVRVRASSIPFRRFIRVPNVSTGAYYRMGLRMSRIRIGLLSGDRCRVGNIIDVGTVTLRRSRISIVASIRRRGVTSSARRRTTLINCVIRGSSGV